MLSMGKKLVDDKKALAERTRSMWMFSRYRAKRDLAAQQHQFEINCILAEREFQKLDKVSKYSSKVEPCKYGLKMLAGVLMGVFSVIMLFHIFCYVVLKVDGKTINPALNNLLESI